MFGSIEQRQTVGRKYAIYSGIKFFLASAFVLAISIARKQDIEAHYDKATCLSCMSSAQMHPATYYEFGKCDTLGFKQDADRVPNLLREDVGIPAYRQQSHVSGYTFSAGILFFLATFVALIYCYLGVIYQGGMLLRYVMHLMYGSVLLTGFLLHVGQMIFELYLRDGCYVSPWPHSYFITEYVLYFVFLGTFLASECSNERFFVGCFFGSLISFLAFGSFCIASAVKNTTLSDQPTQLVFNVVITLGVFEIPLMLVGEYFLKGIFFGGFNLQGLVYSGFLAQNDLENENQNIPAILEQQQPPPPPPQEFGDGVYGV